MLINIVVTTSTTTYYMQCTTYKTKHYNNHGMQLMKSTFANVIIHSYHPCYDEINYEKIEINDQYLKYQTIEMSRFGPILLKVHSNFISGA